MPAMALLERLRARARSAARGPVSPAAWSLFLLLLAAQAAVSSWQDQDTRLQPSLGPAPSAGALRVASLDEPAFAGYATSLYVQGFDAQAGALLPLRQADMAAVRDWLACAFTLNPHSGYPLMLAAFDYAEPAHLGDLERAAAASIATPTAPALATAPGLLDFVESAYREDPARHWRWLAHAAWVARYTLKDDARALRYARLLQAAPALAGVPQWARELDAFVLRRADAIEAHKALLGGLAFATPGADPRELDRLAARLSEHPQTDYGSDSRQLFPRPGEMAK